MTLVLAGILLLLVLSGTLFVARVGRGRGPSRPAGDYGRFETLMGALMLLLGAFPLLSIAPWVHGPANTFWGDSPTHARVAAEIARTGLPHGWLDSYVGGFPFRHHYPALGWLLLAACMRLGLTPAEATHLVGWSATLATPLCLYFFSIRFGARPRFALVGTLLLVWVSPYNAFVGGYETFFNTGLVSQTVGLPICIWMASTALVGSKRWEAPVAAVLAMASHPEVATATLTVLGVAVLAAGRPAAILGCFRVGVFALIAGAALYGQGIATLEIPFGWPPGLGWRQLGFLPSRLAYWLYDGDLLDRARPPVFTALTLAGLGGLFVSFKNPVSRGVGVAFVVGVALSVSGRLLFELGAFGRVLLSFLQPLRISALIPPLAALVVVALLENAAPALERALLIVGRPRWSARVSPLLLLGTLALSLFALPSRVDYTSEVLGRLRSSPTSCGPRSRAPAGYERGRVESWLASLSGGKLWYDEYSTTTKTDCLTCCINLHGLDVPSSVAVATVGGVGGHVGTLTYASKVLNPERAGFTRRAEALGISYWLLSGNRREVPGWKHRAGAGRVQLLERVQGTHRVGLGCIRERYVGTDRKLRARLHAELATPAGADKLLNPEEFVELVSGPGDVDTQPVHDESCDAKRATVRVTADVAGAIAAVVTSQAPVDVVFRASAFPSWRVFDNGRRVERVHKVAPGFFSVRVAPGRHELSARAGLMPGYPALVGLSWLAIALLSFVRARRVWVLLRRAGNAIVRSRPR